ncbi:MAG: GxxExxY protein [Bacteroidia bacterium]|nr:GxxExxY protein [Bacteroidia bacterium]
MTENEISYLIRGSIFKVYHQLGPGLLESVYIATLAYELQKLNLKIQLEVPVPLKYQEKILDKIFRIDILVEDKVLIEVKSIEAIAPVHHKQVLTYLKLTGIKLGILVNFNVDNIKSGVFRKINGVLS